MLNFCRFILVFIVASWAPVRAADFVPPPGWVSGVTDVTDDIMAQVVAMRANPRVIFDGLSTNVTAYTSGPLKFGAGVFVIRPDVLKFAQDLGLQLLGDGSRGTNNALPGRTVIMVRGAGARAIEFYGNGGRSSRIEGIDLVYDDASFSGYLLSLTGAPGATIIDTMIGSYVGGGAGLRTARGVELTYDEFTTFERVVFDGLWAGIWSNDTRTIGGLTFGGADTWVKNCVFYDVVVRGIIHPGNRARSNFNVVGGAINPININVSHGIDLRNVQNFSIKNMDMVGSVGNYATGGWVNIENATGEISGVKFGAFAPTAAILNGQIVLTGNFIDSVDGFNMWGGIITANTNRFNQSGKAYTATPTQPLAVVLGPDRFSGSVVYSYYFPTNSPNLQGRITRAPLLDGSVGGVINAATSVMVTNF